MSVTPAKAVRGRAWRDSAGRGPAPSLSLLGTADSVRAATHAQALCTARACKTGGEGPCPINLAARHSRQLHDRDTRIGGARPGPGETRRGWALLPPSRCSAQPTVSGPHHMLWLCAVRTRQERFLPPPSRCSAQPTALWPRHSHRRCAARAGRDSAGRGLLPPSRCSAQLRATWPRHTHRRCAARAGRDSAGEGPAPSLSLRGTAESDMAATHAQAVRGPSRLDPAGRGPALSLLAARHSQQLHGRDTRTGSARPEPARPDG